MLSPDETANSGFDAVSVPFYRVAVIGGGFCGASVARELALSGAFSPGEIAVFEPRERLGVGLPYGTDEPALRLNVAAARMRALPEDPEAFARFMERSGRLAADPQAQAPGGVFARRVDFAAFVDEVMQPFLRDGRIAHVRAMVADVRRTPQGWHIRMQGGQECHAATLVLAIGHPAASVPAPLAAHAGNDPRILTDPARLEAVAADESLLIVGAGLTALDFLAALERRGHRGPVALLCRSGILPQPQARTVVEPFGDFLSPASETALDLLRRVRAAIRAAQAAGLGWHNVFDRLRKQAQPIWMVLPPSEKSRFLRHLRRRYEMSRFRMPPQNEALLQALREEGRLELLAGQVEKAETEAGGVAVTLRLKKEALPVHRVFSRVAVATGPDQRSHFHAQPWLAALVQAGEIAPDTLGLGIACDEQGRAIGGDGRVRDDLYIAGPVSRGTFGEVTGAPEIAEQARMMAQWLAKALF